VRTLHLATVLAIATLLTLDHKLIAFKSALLRRLILQMLPVEAAILVHNRWLFEAFAGKMSLIWLLFLTCWVKYPKLAGTDRMLGAK